ncbi:MAG: hypothetical protein K2W85_13785 [Phycisphaerales bacterium]|nr:hypothetical protein [Phycisphaerales bacterium]
MPEVAECHGLMLLQTSSEKLAKAVLIASGSELKFSHVAVTKIIDALRGQRFIAKHWNHGDYGAFLTRARKIMRAIEELHPQVPTDGFSMKEGGPNVEYPWPAKSADGTKVYIAPVEFRFPLVQMLQTPDGVRLLKLLKTLASDFDELFG